MKHFPVIFLFFLLLLGAELLAREPVDGQVYWIGFADKGSVSEMHFTPQDFLSPRAIERRRRFGIPLCDDDFPVNSAYLEQLRKQGVTVIGVSRWLNGALVRSDDEAAIDRIDRLSFVRKEEKRKPAPQPKRWRKVNCGNEQIPIADSLYGQAFGAISLLQGDWLHRQGLRGGGIAIAVIDEGFYGVDVHPAFDLLRSSGRLLGCRDFTGKESAFFSYERANHGTKVLSCLAANRPDTLVGTAPEASYWLLSSEYSPEESPLEEYYWVFAAEFADSVGVDVISSSLGYSRFDDSRKNYTPKDFYIGRSPASKAAACAWRKGIVVVASAGNEGQSEWQYLLFPGETPEIITVGAINGQGRVSDFSSRGYRNRRVVKPDVVVPGEHIYVADGTEGYMYQDGTSFAAPLASGLLACCLQANPLLRNDELKRLLIESATFYKKPNRCYGYGMPAFGNMLDCIKTESDNSPSSPSE